jgi:ectoine hydroxylase
MSHHTLSAEQCKSFEIDGYLRLPGFLRASEISPLADRLAADPGLFSRVGALDWIGWTEPGDDLAGTLTCLARFVDAAESLLGERCYHWHSKVVRKPPGGDETLAWHQDFGSWYKDGCLAPSLVTCVVALTPATATNGCLRLMTGSHRLGRLDRLKHGIADYSYFRLNPARLDAISARFPVCEMHMAPGDVFIFHSNTLHSSGPNTADGPRTLLEITYNAVSNPPVFDGQEVHAPGVLTKKSDTCILDGDYDTIIERTRLVDINNPDDPGIQIFRRRFDPGLC